MTIDELITYCEEKEHNHRLSCKRYDDASGYTRSKDKNIRTACAIREEKYAVYYKEISATMRKYQKIKKIANDKNINGDLLRMSEIRWVLKNGDDD
jgi:hypothetical protein